MSVRHPARHPQPIIDKINDAYNPEWDYDVDSPPVPWHVAELVDAVQWLYEQNQKLQERIEELEVGGYRNTR